jgi:pimeloyl-ACP methyl ester carboxylesterase
VELHYEAWGDRGLPIVILHGLFGSSTNWRTVAKQLALGFRVLAVDQRNHGHSPHSSELGYDTLASDVLELVDRLAIAPAAVLGHSMGGKTAMRLALDHAEQVSHLIVVDIAPTKQSEGLRPVLDAMLAVDPSEHASRNEVDRALGERIPDTRLRQFLLTNLERDHAGTLRWRLNLPGIDAGFSELAGAIDGDHPYLGPTLFIRGEYSDYVRDADLAVIRRLFPAAELETIPGAGHWVHAEAPAALVRVVSDFLSRAPASG